MMRNFAYWIGTKLIVRDVDGHLRPPGAGPGVRLLDADGTEMTAIARGTAFDLYFVDQHVHRVAIDSRTAFRFAVWVLRWWVWHAWFGLKLRLWFWVQATALMRKHERKSIKRVARQRVRDARSEASS